MLLPLCPSCPSCPSAVGRELSAACAVRGVQLAVNHTLPRFLEAHPEVKLVVIDSVAFHFRHDYEEMAQRTRLLSAYSQSLTAMAKRFGVAVVLMNQVTTKFDGGGGGSAEGGGRRESAGTLVPALGNSWAHACTTRCMLYWERGSRYARLIKSPNLPDMIVPYEITADGVVDAQDALAGAAAS